MQSSARAPTNQPQLAVLRAHGFYPFFSLPDSHELEMNGQQSLLIQVQYDIWIHFVIKRHDLLRRKWLFCILCQRGEIKKVREFKSFLKKETYLTFILKKKKNEYLNFGMRLFLDWITSINLSAASYNNNASLFSLSFFSPSRHRFHFIDANPARSSSSIPMMLVSSVCNRLCVLSLSFFIFLSTCSFLRVCLCLVVLVIGRRIWMKKSSGLLYDQAVFLYPSRVFFFSRLFPFHWPLC
jgi:hypothetical protein